MELPETVGQVPQLPAKLIENLSGKQNSKWGHLTVESLLEAALNHSSLVLWATDQNGNYILSRGAGLHEIGLSDNECLGQNAFEMYAEYPDICQSIRDCLAGKEHHNIVDVGGSIFESWYCPLRDEAGAVIAAVGISSAITELASAQKALYDATLHFRMAFQGSPVMMAILKIPTGELLEVNNSFERITGYSREEVKGHTPTDLLLWERPFLPANPNFDWYKVHSFHDEPVQAISKNGEKIELIASGAKIRFQSADCLLLFARDATQEKKAKRALQKSERRFSTLAKHAPVGIFQCNSVGEIQYANQYFWSCFPKELVSSTELEEHSHSVRWFELFEPEPQTPNETAKEAVSNNANEVCSIAKEWKKSLQTPVSFRGELMLKAPAREVHWAQIQIDRISEDEDTFLGMVMDITSLKQSQSASVLKRQELEKAVRSRTSELEALNQRLQQEVEKRKQIAEELRFSEEHLQSILENAADFIVHVSMDGKILFVNRFAPGVKREEVIGSHISSWYVNDEERETNTERLNKILLNGESVSSETRVLYPTGETAIHSVRGTPILIDGKIVGASLVSRDVTRERELEEQSRKRLIELSHMSRLSLMGEMSASMSHELKQPLLAIGNYAEGCLMRIQEGTLNLAEATEYLGVISKLAQKSRDILKRTRDFTANRPYAPSPTDLQQVVEDSLQLVQSELKLKKIQVIQNYDPDLSKINIDAIQIQQVIVNMLVNAIEAISSSSKKIEHSIRIRGINLNSKSLSLQIQDTADGVAPEMQVQVFDAFRSSKKEGLGMGLAISRGIVENHGGILSLKETSEAGSTFEMTLPCCKPEDLET